MELYNYQEDIINRVLPVLKERRGFSLFLEMGLGKTLISLTIAKRLNKPIIWYGIKRIEKQVRKTAELVGVDILFLSTGLPINKHIDTIMDSSIEDYQNCLMIIDEAHYFKNFQHGTLTHRTNQLLNFVCQIQPYTLLLTGTPKTTCYTDLISLAMLSHNTLGVNEIISDDMMDYYWTYYAIRKEWFYKIETAFGNEFEVKNLDEFLNAFDNRIVMSKADVETYNVKSRFNVINYELFKEQKEILNYIRKNKYKNTIDDTVVKETINTVACVLDGFHKVESKKTDEDEIKTIWSDKYFILYDLLEKLNGEKVIITCRFKKTLELLEKTLKKWCFGCSVIKSSSTNKKKQIEIEKFRNENQILLATGDSIATGLNFEFCSHMVLFSMSFNYSNSSQLLDRIRRITSTKNVNYYYFSDERGIEDHLISGILNKVRTNQLFLTTLNKV